MLELINQKNWTGRFDDEDGGLGKRWHQEIQFGNFAHFQNGEHNSVALLGFCSDEGVRRNKGRTGARNAPAEIRKMLANLPYLPEQKQIFDFGNVILNGNDLETARKEQTECVSELIRNHYLPIVLGGGHETALGDFLGLAAHYRNIAIINIDAHFDIRIPVENSTSGTPFFEMAEFCRQNQYDFNYFCIGIQRTGNTEALFKRAEELNVKTILADEIHIDLNNALRQLEDYISEYDVVYLSLDMDVLDCAFAPGVSAPCVNGLMPFQVKSIIQKIIQSGKLKLFDVVELNPEFDQDNRTAKLVAHYIWEVVNS